MAASMHGETIMKVYIILNEYIHNYIINLYILGISVNQMNCKSDAYI
jgi:hypothetical protein